MNGKKYFFLLFYLSFQFSQSQNLPFSNKFSLPMNQVKFLFDEELKKQNNNYSTLKKTWNVDFNFSYILNKGHSNVDNNSEFYSTGPVTKLISSRFNYYNKWIYIELEPYAIQRRGSFKSDLPKDSYYYLNNHSISNNHIQSGIRRSQAIIHYKGLGLGYGIINNWWSSGNHSAIALSSNAPGQKTYSVGTFKPLRYKKILFYTKFIVKPYNNEKGEEIFFSGIKSYITLDLKSKITLGFHRTYLSGNIKEYFNKINYNKEWSILDASKLVFEPLFSSQKENLDYTYDNVPGSDRWDQILTGYINLLFPDEQFEISFEVSSDDSRANFTDLRAHWNHSIGYIVSIKKYFKISRKNLLIFNIEYLSTKLSNTFNPAFWRGNGFETNYYYKQDFDYFTYKGRRMGAHSGSSSDDLLIMLGYGNDNYKTFIKFNKERHGLKSMVYPELKNEISLIFDKKINNNSFISINFETEKIRNFGFIKDINSSSEAIFLGYTFSILN